MPTVNELLADDAMSHAVDLAQYSNSVVRRMIALLNRVDTDLADALTRALGRLPASSFTVERLESLLVSVRRLNSDAYRRVEVELKGVLEEFAVYESEFQQRLFEVRIPEGIQVRYRIARVTPSQVYAAAMSRPFQGRLLRDWSKKLAADRLEILRNTVRAGFIEGKTVPEIVRKLIGTKAQGYADGSINRSRRDLTAVVHTAISHTAEMAREKFHAANADLIGAIVWQATLDTKTSETCRIRDGKRYTSDPKHRPIGHSIPWLQGPGRSHWRCRSTSRPQTKSWRELGFDVDELDAGARASMDGQVAGDVQFGDWLQRQSAYRQEQVLGATRARLMRDGGMELPQFYSDTGQYLTLQELRERNQGAFRRAGLISSN